MSLTIQVSKDTLTPDMRDKLRTAKNPKPVWEAVGTQLLSITKRAFTDPSMRTATWPAKHGGEPSNLIKKGALLSSIRVTVTDDKSVSIGSDRIYAAIQQLGGVIRPKGGKKFLVFTVGGVVIRCKKVTIPARPFFPFTKDGALAPRHVARVRNIVEVAMAKRLGIK